MTHDAFRAWSLLVFINLLAYDSVRILIWLDHMGLRVATLVNLSFLGMDKLEQRLARLAGPGGDGPLHSRGSQAVHHLGPSADPLLYPPRQRLGPGLEHGRGHSQPCPGRIPRHAHRRSRWAGSSFSGPGPSPF